MDPEFVEDWAKTQARFDAWWRCEIVDRPPVFIACPRKKPRWPLRPLPENVEPERKHLDIAYRIDEIENTLAATDYFGDAIPNFRRGINTAYLGAFAGARPEFAEATVWIEPFVTDWAEAQRPKFDTDLPMFKRIVEVGDALAENARGRYMLAVPDHLDAITTMSQMRGVEDLCVELAQGCDAASAFRDEFVEVWKRSCDFWLEHDPRAGFDGTINWASAYGRNRVNVLQCDFSAMISPTMFERFVRPELASEAAHLDAAMYHLDGPGQIPHVDLLCDIPGVSAVQWVTGAGNPGPVEWPDLFKRLQAKGKAIQVYCCSGELDRLFEFLKPEGVYFMMRNEKDPGACRDALRRIEKWAAGSRA